MSANIDTLREAVEKAVQHFDSGQFAAGDAVLREALAASKPEPQAQAGEPEVAGIVDGDEAQRVVLWHPGIAAFDYPVVTDLITLQSHREAMVEAERCAKYWENEARRYVGNADFWREKNAEKNEAIAKKDAALKACVEALEYSAAFKEGGREKARAAITQAQEAQR